MKYKINYGFGTAYLYTPCVNWKERFYELANQCFGIRKSIMYAHLITTEDAAPKDIIDGEHERLEHNGDVIIWNAQGEKIKDEWE